MIHINGKDVTGLSLRAGYVRVGDTAYRLADYDWSITLHTALAVGSEITDHRDIDSLPRLSIVQDRDGDLWYKSSDTAEDRGWIGIGGNGEFTSYGLSNFKPIKVIHLGPRD